MKLVIPVILLLCSQWLTAQPISYPLLPGERWYGGAVTEGGRMPFSDGYAINLVGDNKGNQSSSFFVSTMGRFLWSDQPFALRISNGHLELSGTGIHLEKAGADLRAAYLAGSKKYFPASGQLPDTTLIAAPQYNTWIELLYNQNQADILQYAHQIIDQGFPPGVLMIDDNWFPAYGNFHFRSDRFSDPKQMIRELHQLGFKVMVWISPFVSPDGEVFRDLLAKKFLLFDNRGNDTLSWTAATEPLITHWWNGYSAQLDLSHPEAVQWLLDQLHALQESTGVDGFKLDAGDMEYYPANMVSYRKLTANEMCRRWGDIGLHFPLNEYRANWQHGGQPLVERLRDKAHSWSDLQQLIPHTLAAGLLGYAYVCPDMIGGGEFTSFLDQKTLHPDLIVRSAQCQALMPMMQFSVAPWRVLDSVHFAAVQAAVALRMRYTPYILQLAREAALSGEPIVRSLEYEFPHQGFEAVQDQFMLGSRYLVCPVLTAGASRTIRLPKGTWKTATGEKWKGPKTITYTADLNTLPVLEKLQ